MSKVAITGNASGTGVFTVASPNSNVDRVLTLPDETGTVITTATTLVPSTTNTSITLGTAVATTSGTSIDFTGIPAGVKRVTVMFKNVSTNGSADKLIRIGTSSGIEETGYLGAGSAIEGTGVGATSSTTAFMINSPSASYILHGGITLSLDGTNSWVAYGVLGDGSVNRTTHTAGSKTLGGTLDRVRLTTVNGTDTFDLGSVNISWEF